MARVVPTANRIMASGVIPKTFKRLRPLGHAI
jgi:hypothetical protein